MSKVDGVNYFCFGMCTRSTPYTCCSTADRAWCAEGENEEGRPCMHLVVCKKHEGEKIKEENRGLSMYPPKESPA